jgi:hypothetical protein
VIVNSTIPPSVEFRLSERVPAPAVVETSGRAALPRAQPRLR